QREVERRAGSAKGASSPGRAKRRKTRARNCFNGPQRRTEQRHHAFFYFGGRWTTSRWQVQRIWSSHEGNGSGRRNQSRAVGRGETRDASAHQTWRRRSMSEMNRDIKRSFTPLII